MGHGENNGPFSLQGRKEADATRLKCFFVLPSAAGDAFTLLASLLPRAQVPPLVRKMCVPDLSVTSSWLAGDYEEGNKERATERLWLEGIN